MYVRGTCFVLVLPVVETARSRGCESSAVEDQGILEAHRLLSIVVHVPWTPIDSVAQVVLEGAFGGSGIPSGLPVVAVQKVPHLLDSSRERL